MYKKVILSSNEMKAFLSVEKKFFYFVSKLSRIFMTIVFSSMLNYNLQNAIIKLFYRIRIEHKV